MQNMNKSIYKYAAEAGLPVGLYLTFMAACLFVNLKIESSTSLIFVLMIGFPILLGYKMRQIAVKEPSYMKVSALWLGGIYTVIFGSLICALFSGIYLVFIDPGFINAMVLNAVNSLEESPMAFEYSSTITLMRDAVDAHLLPTGMEFVSTMGWLTCFCGSILSLILSLIIVKTGARRKKLIMEN